MEKSDGVLNRLLLTRKTGAEPVSQHHVLHLDENPDVTVDKHAEKVKKFLDETYKSAEEDSSSSRVWVAASKALTDLTSIFTSVKDHPHVSRTR